MQHVPRFLFGIHLLEPNVNEGDTLSLRDLPYQARHTHLPRGDHMFFENDVPQASSLQDQASFLQLADVSIEDRIVVLQF